MNFKFLKSPNWQQVFAQIDLKNATIKIKDGTGSPNELTVTIGEGNLTYNESRNIEYTLDRGNLDEVRLGDDIPMDVSIDATWEYVTTKSTGSTPTIEDALKQRAGAVDWISTDSDTCRPFAVDIEITYAPTPSSCGDQEVILLQDFRYESIDHDLRGGTFAISGKCNVTEATVTRTAQ